VTRLSAVHRVLREGPTTAPRPTAAVPRVSPNWPSAAPAVGRAARCQMEDRAPHGAAAL